MNKVIISVIGPDKPGIIASIAKALFESGCNIENVSQTILQGEFSGIFIASMDQEVSTAVLQSDLRGKIAPLGQHVHVKQLGQSIKDPVFEGSEPFVITTRGPDRLGLVAYIAGVIARFGVNVTNLQAIFKGGDDPLNNMMIYEVDIPRTADTREFGCALRRQASELGLDISIQHRKVFESINRV
jgi:glycine cleavage system transcriptional repressor